MSTPTVRVRIAPSPTGEPHVGTAYVALFNLAMARKHGGQFILRIEDTDQERSRPEWEREIMNGLRWMGLEWDEGPDKGGPYGPYRQSERQAIYAEHTELLIERGAAYRCFCTKERLDALREQQKLAKQDPGYDRHCRHLPADEVERRRAAGEPFVVRLAMPTEGQTIVDDGLRGQVTFDNIRIDDQVLLKSDGFPTYHLANVVDDHLMKITHVIRAEEWINSTPKHLVLYRGFGWEPPAFYHLPLLRNDDKSKISKRKNPVSILDYKQRGFLPEAVRNYLAMMGWTMPDGREVFTTEEFFQNFDWARVSLGGPTFDLGKLAWLNGKYYREKLDDAALGKLVRDTLFSEAYLARIVPLVRERIDTLEQFIPATEFFFRGDVTVDVQELKPKKRTFKEVAEILELLAADLDKQVDFSPTALEAMLRAFAEKNGWKSGDLFMPVRVATTGRSATPPLFDTLSVLGRALVRRRIRAAIELSKAAAQAEAKAAAAAPKAEGKAPEAKPASEPRSEGKGAAKPTGA
jgi:glutamyl-tRNA synthetase